MIVRDIMLRWRTASPHVQPIITMVFDRVSLPFEPLHPIREAALPVNPASLGACKKKLFGVSISGQFVRR